MNIKVQFQLKTRQLTVNLIFHFHIDFQDFLPLSQTTKGTLCKIFKNTVFYLVDLFAYTDRYGNIQAYRNQLKFFLYK